MPKTPEKVKAVLEKFQLFRIKKQKIKEGSLKDGAPERPKVVAGRYYTFDDVRWVAVAPTGKGIGKNTVWKLKRTKVNIMARMCGITYIEKTVEEILVGGDSSLMSATGDIVYSFLKPGTR